MNDHGCSECGKDILVRPRIDIIVWGNDDAFDRTFCSPKCLANYCDGWDESIFKFWSEEE